MRIILSPAKKMNADTDSFLPKALPVFLMEAEAIKSALQAMSPEALQKLWKCNDAIAKVNVARLENMDLTHALTPAILLTISSAVRAKPPLHPSAHFCATKAPLRV